MTTDDTEKNGHSHDALLRVLNAKAPMRSMRPSLHIAPVSRWYGTRQPILTNDQARRLADIATPHAFAAGTVLFRAGDTADALFNPVSGLIKTVQSRYSQRHSIMNLIFANDLCGIISANRYHCTGVAIRSTMAYRIPMGSLLRLMSSDNELQLAILRKLADMRDASSRRAFVLSTGSPAMKVAYFILLLRQTSALCDNRDEVLVPVPRDDIADFIGLSKTTMRRAFQKLAEDGVIDIGSEERITIRSPDDLYALVATVW